MHFLNAQINKSFIIVPAENDPLYIAHIHATNLSSLYPKHSIP